MRIRGLMMCVLISMVSLILLPSTKTYASVEFKDTANHWAKSAIVQAAEEGLLTGYEDGTFRPNASISRAEFIAIVARLLELQAGQAGEGEVFNDIKGYWAELAISSAVGAGVIVPSEYGSKFEPAKPITRLEMSKMIGRSLALQADYEMYLESFRGLYNGDIPVTDWKKIKSEDVPLIGLAFGSGVIGGYPDDSFGLDKNATRAEATVMLLRLKDAKEKNPEEFMALKELKAVAETGSNLSVVEPDYRLERNLAKKPIDIEHFRYIAKVKRYYVINLQDDRYRSIYYNKYIGDKADIRNKTIKDREGLGVVVSDVTTNYSDAKYFTYSSLTVSPFYEPYIEGIAKKFNYINPQDQDGTQTKKGITQEWVMYAGYGKDDDLVYVAGVNATKGSSTLIMSYGKVGGK